MVCIPVRGGFAGVEGGGAYKRIECSRSRYPQSVRPARQVVTPSIKDYETAGEILAGLQRSKGYDIKKSASLTNDCLIAASARSMEAVLYTQNKKDFQTIQDVFDCKVAFV